MSETTLEVAFSDTDPSDAVKGRITEHVDKLTEMYDRITSVRVVVAEPHRHGHQGKLFEVHIELGVPGDKLIVDRQRDDHSHEDVYVALRDAFKAAERQLRDYAEKQKDHGRGAS